MFPNPYKRTREKTKGEREVVGGEYLLTLFRALRIPIPFKSDVDAIRRVGVLIVRKYPIILQIVDGVGRAIQKPKFWRS